MADNERRGRSPPRKSNRKEKDMDTAVLDSHIRKNTQSTKTNKVATVAVAMTVSLLPSYLYQAVMDMDWSEYLPYYIIFPGCAAVLLTFAYQMFFDANFTHKTVAVAKRDESFGERETLRYQMAMGKSLAFSNALFLGLALFFLLYLLKAFDKRVNFSMSILAAAGLVYWLAAENEKTVKKNKAKA
eukprot:NODE_1888_length_819_cov_160.718182_g1489_i0.p1 GENE.NODE_1888_length_819_cov_160.718182_g1489_i0~~NODE_1888_length_819_cov_160.718182_g1489_i0.p1  ORF type:complete len:186 (-),score=44.71 NODE_1888_length_819_cov_160.718182_g1489_i0:207-764(-)